MDRRRFLYRTADEGNAVGSRGMNKFGSLLHYRYSDGINVDALDEERERNFRNKAEEAYTDLEVAIDRVGELRELARNEREENELEDIEKKLKGLLWQIEEYQ